MMDKVLKAKVELDTKYVDYKTDQIKRTMLIDAMDIAKILTNFYTKEQQDWIITTAQDIVGAIEPVQSPSHPNSNPQ